MKTKSKIPDRWLNYSPIGTPIAGTRFIAFKVPLKIELCKRIRPNAWFTPEHLLHNVGRFGSQLGLLIDLTNTDRYYDPSMLTYSGVEYAKIFCAGHEIPNLDVIRRFYAIIDKYEELYENKDLLIGVHCTHGVNRTGYLICRYLIERMGWSAEQALTRYGEARGHEIERKPYIHDLYQTEKYPVFTEKELTQNSLEEPGNTKNMDWRFFEFRVYKMTVSLAENVLSEAFRKKYGAEFLIPGGRGGKNSRNSTKNSGKKIDTSALFEELAKNREKEEKEKELWLGYSSFNYWSTPINVACSISKEGELLAESAGNLNLNDFEKNGGNRRSGDNYEKSFVPDDVFVVEGSLSDIF